VTIDREGELSVSGAERSKAPGRVRRIAFFALIVLFALMHILLTPMMFAILGWFLESETAVSHRIHETAFGFIFVVSFVGLLVQLRRPDRKPAAMYMVAVPIWFLAAAVLVVDRAPDPIVFLFIVIPIALIALHPARSRILHPEPRASPPMLALALVAALPLTVFAIAEVRLGFEASEAGRAAFESLPEDLEDDEFEAEVDRRLRRLTDSAEEFETARHFGHWSAMGGFALSVAALAVMASLRPTGRWRLLAWAAGLALSVYGIASLIAPNDASAANTVWAVLAVGWGVAFVVVTERIGRPSLTMQEPLPEAAGP
jgi:hypothetical protein